VEEGDPLPLGADTGNLVDKPESGVTAPLQHAVEVVHGETDMVNAGPTLGDVFPDRGVVSGGLQQFHERLACGEADDAGAVRIIEGHLRHLQDVAEDGQQVVDGAHGNPDVGDARAAAKRFGHDGLRSMGARRVNSNSRSARNGHRAASPSTEQMMANAVEVNDGNFATEIQQHDGLAMVDFWATWCAPCRMIAPIVEALATEFAGQVKIAKLDVDHNPRTAAQFNVRSIPTILFFKNGQLIDQVVGAVPRPALEAKIKEHA